jgi:preprotein translocase subunit SecA
MSLLSRLFNRPHVRLQRRLAHTVAAANAMEPAIKALDDVALQAKTSEFRLRLAMGESLDDLAVEAFAVVREAAHRVLGLRPYDVQIMGGLALHLGMIAEMQTGEGKTLVATLPTYLNALSGRGVHVVTVNDYLARRDADQMGAVHRFLGLSVGCVTNEMGDEARRAAYGCDITYGTNAEFGFDYLRDHMKMDLGEMVQRPFHYAIIDEVDSILIDEARTPLVISGQVEDQPGLYLLMAALVPSLVSGEHYEIDEKHRSVWLHDQGIDFIESRLREFNALLSGGLYDPENITLLHHVTQALRAQALYHRDKDYIVIEGKVVLVDEFTGRAMDGRRFSDGLHQALEAKEGVEVQGETRTIASITYQNFFRLYHKLAGMTGTARSDAMEFWSTYRLEVLPIPTNRPVVRLDGEDQVFLTAAEKVAAMLTLISDRHRRGQPILIGTASVEKSEALSAILTKVGIPHNVLNARQHALEAHIIAQAGRPGAVTIATNMAGRGTDILLGGNLAFRLADEVAEDVSEDERQRQIAAIEAEVAREREQALAAGGLLVIGTERHESRRIDEQLRGRSGRQGDPGESVFFLSYEDDLMRLFASPEQIKALFTKIGHRPGEEITHPWVTKAVGRAQRRVEGRNFDIRKSVLEYDDIVNNQRKVVYSLRHEVMTDLSIHDLIEEYRYDLIEELVSKHMPDNAFPEQWDATGLAEDCLRLFNIQPPCTTWFAEEGVAKREVRDRLQTLVAGYAAQHEALFDEEEYRMLCKHAFLKVLDRCWQNHLTDIEALRQGIYLRSFAQRNPLLEFSSECFSMFEAMLSEIKATTCMLISHSMPVSHLLASLMPETAVQMVVTQPVGEAAAPLIDD